MVKKLERLLEKKLAQTSDKINKQWFYDIIGLFLKYNYDDDIFDLVEIVFNVEEINRMNINPPKILLNTPAAKKSLAQFMKYLDKKLAELQDAEVQEFFDEVVEFMQENIDPDVSNSTNLIKFTTLKFSKDIKPSIDNLKKFEADPEKNQVYIRAKLDEFVLASMKAHKSINENKLYFDHLKTLNGVERQHLGYMVMFEFFKFVRKYAPYLEVHGQGLQPKNLRAQMFYQSLGGVFYDAKTMQPIPYEQLARYSFGAMGIYFDKRKIKQLSNGGMAIALSLDEYKERELRRNREMDHPHAPHKRGRHHGPNHGPHHGKYDSEYAHGPQKMF